MASMAMTAAAGMANGAAVLFGRAGEIGEAWGGDDLVLEYMPMVRAIARKLHRGLPQHIELEDLVSAGVLGLLDSSAKFDAARHASFKTYAQFRVRGAILDSLRELDWGTRDLRRRGRDIQTAIATCAQRLRRTPEEAEIASELGIGVAELRASLGDLHQLEVGSLQVERGEDSDEEEISYLADPSEPGALFHCLKGELRQHLVEAIDELPERERLVITLYYYEELTLKEIGSVLGVVESRVSQLRSSGVLRLRAALEKLR